MTSAHDKAVLNSIFNPLLPLDAIVDEPVESSAENAAETETDAVKQAKTLEIEGVKFAESGNLNDAMRCFDDAVKICPDRASVYNNRAQLWRLKGEIQMALDDLNKAIELRNSTGTAACQAFCQRGMIRRLQGDECGAKDDFENAAKLGSNFAKTQLITMNPYAAMCNKMLADVMGRLRRGEPEDQTTDSHPAA